MNKELLTGRNGLPVPGWNGIDGEKTVVIMAHGFGSAKEGFTGTALLMGTASPSNAASTAIRRRNSGSSNWRRTPRSATLVPALAHT